MILDVFPSYKDKDMVDLLYQYQRDSRLSISLLVEQYLSDLLYKKGYCTVKVDEEELIDEDRNDNEEIEKSPRIDDMAYIQHNKSGMSLAIRKNVNGINYVFGSYGTIEEAKKVRDFLISKNWDLKYSTKTTGLRGEKHAEWVFSEIENEVAI